MLFLTVLSLAIPVLFAKPSFLKTNQDVVKDEYIVTLHTHLGPADLGVHLKELQKVLNARSPDASFQPYMSLAEIGFPSYTVSALSGPGLDYLLQHNDVRSVEPVGYVNATSDGGDAMCSQSPTSSMKAQNNAVWGLARTTSRSNPGRSAPYYYNEDALGKGINAYILDTGVYCGHQDFTSKSEGTCKCGYVANGIQGIGSCTSEKGGYSDGNGHGTHVASTVAGQIYGIAKSANVIAVKVLNTDGLGTWSGVLGGVNYVVSKGGPGVACLSLGGGYSYSVNEALNACVSSGVQAFIASGNNFANACNFSPASATLPVTVGATNAKDQRSSYSNYGDCVDIMAPGTSIDAAGIKNAWDVSTLSGTSMAAPHVAGVAAKMLSMNSGITTANVKEHLLASATQGKLSNLNGSPDLLLYGLC